MIELDAFFLRDHPMDVDFIKIDTDGFDYEVLCGAKTLLSTTVLGVAIECQFDAPVGAESNLFRNIDGLLASLGFSLFDLEVYRYSRAQLPKPFVYRIPAQTHTGQVLWGDALYLRDAAKMGCQSVWDVKFSAQKLMKLACIFEIFGLEDCAAELLVKYRHALAELVDIDNCLDLLTPEIGGRKVTYQRYNELFQQDPTSFYPAE